MARADQTRDATEELQSLLEFETLLSDLSSRFINLPPEQLDPAIEDVQRRVCEVLGVDLSALWEGTADGPGGFVLTCFYASQEDLLPPMRGMRAEEYFPWLRDEMFAGRKHVASRLDAMPEEAAFDRDNLRLFGVQSNLTIPLSVGGEIVGALGFNTTRGEREWPPALVSRLELLAQVFANALARRRADEALRESEQRVRLATESAEAGLWELDYASRLFWLSPRTRVIFGLGPDEMLTVDVLLTLVHPDDRSHIRDVIDRTMVADELAEVEYRVVTRRRELRWLSSRGRPHFDASGRPVRLMGVTVDVSEQRRAQEALRTSENRLQAGADLAGLAFYEVDFSAGTMFSDERLRELVGFQPECQGMEVLDFWLAHLHPDDRRWVMEGRRQLHAGELEQFSLEYRFLNPQRGERWIHHLARAAVRDETGAAVSTYGVLRDVTDRKRAEADLQDLSRRLLRAQEEERAVLARELHDDVSQRLAVLAIDVGRAEMDAADGPHEEAMRLVREGLVRLSEDVHALAYQLHPSVLEELGLAEALRTECERRSRHSEYKLAVSIGELPPRVPREQALCLFRVAQEALNNIARHAGASSASVMLRASAGGVLLAVSDDGRGFDLRSPGHGRRLGVAGMRERVQLVDGTLDVETAPGEGTTVLAWVPVGEVPE
jgi:PAS domain S-box-containing protein